MNVLHINPFHLRGGAARAMYRLHQELQHQGQESHIVVRQSSFQDPTVSTNSALVRGRGASIIRLFDRVARHMAARLGLPFTHYLSTKYILRSDLYRRAEVVNLHNAHGHYFNYHLLPAFSRRKPLIWTLHDMWAITGHCAYAYDCRRWQTGCFDCPLLKEPGRQIVDPRPTFIDCTRQVWHTKRKLYQSSRLYIVTPSQWLREVVEKSILADATTIQFIPNGLDLNIFQPRDQAMARRALDVPQEAKTILFVADRLGRGRKGFPYLLDALDRIQDTDRIVLLTIGAGGSGETRLDRFQHRDLGSLSDERLMSLVYSAADLFVFPTLADNQPLVLIESMACGTPMVSFDVGGVPELVRHMETGYLARYKDAGDLAQGIETLLDNKDLRHRMGHLCREIAESEYSLEVQARRYIQLYQSAAAK